MPRLRRIKEWEDDDLDFSSTAWPSLDTTEDNNGDDYERSGRSWWSNEAVIASMDDSKLRSALTRYRFFVKLCEHEIQRRSLSPRRASRAQTSDNDRRLSNRNQNRPSRSKNGTLTRAQLREALEVLREIQSHRRA